jgi:S1-C subfamily serine protease
LTLHGRGAKSKHEEWISLGMMTKKTWRLVLLVFGAALLAGCKTVAYNPTYTRPVAINIVPRYQGKLLLFTTPSDDKFVFHGHPKSVTGVAWNLKVPLGEMSKKMAGDIYGHLFEAGYEFGHEIDTNNNRFVVILHPQIEDFAWRMNQAKNIGFAITPQVKMTLNLQLLSADKNTVILQRQYESGWVNGNSYLINITPFESVNAAIHETMASLMVDSIRDMDAVMRPNLTQSQPLPPSNSPKFSGTGFFITDDGYLISNYHVVKDATKIRLVTSAGTIDAKVVQVDAANDLALLKADGRFSPLPITSSRTVKLGGTVATVGFPNIGMQGFSPKLAKGEIASLSGAQDDPRYFQISVPVQPGNSGGALVDERGNVIGIVSAKLNASVALAASGSLPENVNYAIKSSFLLSFIESVPAVSAKLKAPVTVDRKFEEVVKSAQDAAVLVLVY